MKRSADCIIWIYSISWYIYEGGSPIMNANQTEPKAGVLRTPEKRFANLTDYPFSPHYTIVDGLRIHYVDEGPADAPPVLLMHGEPS